MANELRIVAKTIDAHGPTAVGVRTAHHQPHVHSGQERTDPRLHRRMLTISSSCPPEGRPSCHSPNAHKKRPPRKRRGRRAMGANPWRGMHLRYDTRADRVSAAAGSVARGRTTLATESLSGCEQVLDGGPRNRWGRLRQPVERRAPLAVPGAWGCPMLKEPPAG